MVKRKEAPAAEVAEYLTHKYPRSTNNSPTMSDSAKPKSSTSEASKTQTRRPLIKRSNDSDDDGDDDFVKSITKSAKPKTSAPKSKVSKPATIKTSATQKKSIQKSSDSDDDESEDDYDNEVLSLTKKGTKSNNSTSTTKNPPAKKQAGKPFSSRVVVEDYDDESDEDDQKPKSKAITSSDAKKLTAKKATAKPSKISDTEDDSDDNFEDDSEDDSGDDSDDDSNDEDLTSNITKPKTSISSITKKQPLESSGKNSAPQNESEDDEEEEDDEDEDDEEEEEATITFSETKGDLFGAPSKALLLHACNCQGSWSKGIAYGFQKNYPDHYALYHNHCRDNNIEDIIGTCLIIPSQRIGKNHWVGCLFTSRKYGRGKDKKDKILDQTERAIKDLIGQIEKMEERPIAVWMCKINSGMFRVPWSKTKAAIQRLTCKAGLHIDVVDKK